jgi:hypothetical protein
MDADLDILMPQRMFEFGLTSVVRVPEKETERIVCWQFEFQNGAGVLVPQLREDLPRSL